MADLGDPRSAGTTFAAPITYPLPPIPAFSNGEDHPVADSSLSITAPQGFMSMEEWIGHKQEVDTQQKAVGLPQQQARSQDYSSANSLAASTNGLLRPVALPKKQNSAHVGRLNHLSQKHGFTTHFCFNEPVPQRFTCSLTLSGPDIGTRTIEGPDLHNTKKEAKEAIAGEACEIVSAMPKASGKRSHSVMKGVGQSNLGREADGSRAVVGHQVVEKPKKPEPEENFIGLLLGPLRQVNLTDATYKEYANANSQPPPVYQDYQLGNSFASEVTIALRPLTSFGSQTSLFPSKKLAKAFAARDAVFWLREQDRMPGPNQHVKKKAKISAANKATGSPSSANGSNTESKHTTHAQQVNELCPRLGFKYPRFELVQSTTINGFFFGAAFFDNNAELPGPIGGVRNVYGKKAAKEECAKRVLEVLRGIEEERSLRVRIQIEQRLQKARSEGAIIEPSAADVKVEA
ncbi:hypothetical protein LTR66_007003 [Elasticomyces elasticus]|nr:hypothetical protein LTR66_007003 [Elasticomyces elasticus]